LDGWLRFKLSAQTNMARCDGFANVIAARNILPLRTNFEAVTPLLADADKMEGAVTGMDTLEKERRILSTEHGQLYTSVATIQTPPVMSGMVQWE